MGLLEYQGFELQRVNEETSTIIPSRAEDGTLSLSKLRNDVQDALNQWHDNNANGSTLSYLHLYRRMQSESNQSARQTSNQVLNQTLQALELEDEKLAKVLRLRFVEQQTVFATANALNLADSTIYVIQRRAIDHLAKLLFETEQQVRVQNRYSLEMRLEPPTYSKLVGVDDHMATLMALLTKAEAPWIISLEGMGGIGKTSLVNALARRMIDYRAFADYGWVTARDRNFDLGGGIRERKQPSLTVDALIEALVSQLLEDSEILHSLPAEKRFAILQSRLRQAPHLIVIDNLETLADIESLLPTLRKLTNPTKFLLTSREHYYSEPGLYHFNVPALSESNSIALIRQEAALSNLPHLAAATDRELQPIYQIVGGNPLAIRLVVGQTYASDLNAVLDDLSFARTETVENLYTYIYRQAWENLDENERLAWLCLPLTTARGANLEDIAEMSAMEPTELRRALSTLVRLNLVDCYGEINDRRYTIHNLTRTFLQEQVAKWQ